MVTGAWLGQTSPGTADQSGSRDKAQLTFNTGLVMRQPSTRSRNASGAAASNRPRVALGSALEMTARARMSSPPARRTPSPGTISATGTPAASTAPRSRAASAMAKEMAPMPPSTYPHAMGTPSSSPRKCMSLTKAVPSSWGPAHAPMMP